MTDLRLQLNRAETEIEDVIELLSGATASDRISCELLRGARRRAADVLQMVRAAMVRDVERDPRHGFDSGRFDA